MTGKYVRHADARMRDNRTGVGEDKDEMQGYELVRMWVCEDERHEDICEDMSW